MSKELNMEHGFDVLEEAIKIFKKYDNPQWPFQCEHDLLIVFVNPSIVSEEDRAKLDNLGFHCDNGDGEYTEGFVSYHFGSA